MGEQMVSSDQNDPFNLKRFLEAQEQNYPNALEELRRGRKDSHWMWYVFPQLDGLGSSSTARFYGIKSLEEAETYLRHPVLGHRLRECSEALLQHTGKSAHQIFGSPDDMKLKSSATLFALVSAPDSVFERILAQYCQGQRDNRTLQLLGKTS